MPVVEKRGPAGAVPAGLERFYGQPLRWDQCAPYAVGPEQQAAYAAPGLLCATLTVPLDYDAPQGDTITIGLLRVRAADPAHRIGSVVVNPGGPGGSGMEFAASMAKTWRGTELGRRFDLVGFDPRGVGASRPQIRCLTGPEFDANRAADLDDDPTPAGVARYEQQQMTYAKDCADRSGDGARLLANVGTRDVARDMDVLRSALGDPKLTYLGYSYGTALGTAYAERFPANVRALVLDGAVDPMESPADEAVSQGAGFQKAFDQFSQWCAKRKDCALGTDPASATATFRALVNPLLDHPVTISDGRPLGYDDATTGVIEALYQPDTWPALNAGLGQLRHGDGNTLMQLADLYEGRSADGGYSNEQDAFTAIRCVDDPPVTDANVLLDSETRYKMAAPFLDNGRPASPAHDACAFWPVPPTDQPHVPNVPGLVPVLVISTTNDPATPYQAGVNLANALRGGLLTFEGTQHTAFLRGNTCVDRWGTNYLINLTLPPAGVRCR